MQEENINTVNNFPDFFIEQVENEDLLTNDESDESDGMDHTESRNKNGNVIEIKQNYFVEEIFQNGDFQDYIETFSIQTEFRARLNRILADALAIYSQDREDDHALKLFNSEHKLTKIRASFSRAVQHLFVVLSSDVQLLMGDQQDSLTCIHMFDDTQLFIACK